MITVRPLCVVTSLSSSDDKHIQKNKLKAKIKLVNSKQMLQRMLYRKIEQVRNDEGCDPFKYTITKDCELMWDEIEELSRALCDVKKKLKYFDNEYIMRNIELLNLQSKYDNSLDL